MEKQKGTSKQQKTWKEEQEWIQDYQSNYFEEATEIYNILYHATLQDAPDWIWDKTKRSIHDLRVWGCHVEAKIDSHVPNLDSRTEDGYYMGTTATKAVIKYWRT